MNVPKLTFSQSSRLGLLVFLMVSASQGKEIKPIGRLLMSLLVGGFAVMVFYGLHEKD